MLHFKMPFQLDDDDVGSDYDDDDDDSLISVTLAGYRYTYVLTLFYKT